MSNIQEFAAFVKNERLDEFVSSYITMLRSFNIPLLDLLKHLDEEEMHKRSTEGLVLFLDGLKDGNAIEIVKQRLQLWEEDKLPGISKNSISVTDITFIYTAQKISLLTFIPYFSKDSFVAINIVLELELYYKEVRELSLAVINKIEAEEKLKLQETEELYKDLFDNANDLIQFVDIDGKILYANNAWLNTLKYKHEELKGKDIFSFIIEEDRKTYYNQRQNVIHGISEIESVNTCFLTKDGNQISIEGYITCKHKNGVPQYTRGILRDVTKRKEDEKKLKFYNERLIEREENLNRLIQNAPDAIIVIDEFNKILLWNPKAEIIFGWKADEVIGLNLSNIIIPEEYKAAHNAGMKRFKSTGVSHVIGRTIEITAINKARKTFFVSLTISQSKEAGKNIFIAFIRDITLQKKNEQELENKRKQLEQSNEELEQYAWLASHDLKEPLRKIMTFSDILITRYAPDLPDVVQKHLKKINDSTKRMDSLIEAIMVYSNVTDNNDLFVETDLNVVIKEVLADLEIAIKNKNATITISSLPKVEAIRIQMRQLIQNLVANAVKYSKPDQAPVINISSEVKDGICHIKIMDNGIGFHNQYSEKIFQVFQRLSTGDRYEGTGIGLALCKKIVETHGGTITAESEEGKGTTFFVTLPVIHKLPIS